MFHTLAFLTSLISLIPVDGTEPSNPAGSAFSSGGIILTCPEETKLSCGGSIHPDDTGYALASTSCATPATVTYSDAPVSLTNCPTDRFESVIARTWTAVDACGNQASCLQYVIVIRQVWELDILPDVCPNDVDPQVVTGTIQVAISGLPAQNVADLIPASLAIWTDDCQSGPVAPTSVAFADVSTPYFMDTKCGCLAAAGDGVLDLVLTFPRAAFVGGLNLASHAYGSSLRLAVTGTTVTGCSFLALDCVRIQQSPDCNGNGVPDSIDIANGTSFDLDLDGVPDTCEGTQGCSHGYWKNHPAAWAATGYTVTQDFDTVFGVDAFTPNRTLLQALKAGGGGMNNLGRQAVAALLDAAHPGVDFPLMQDEVILAVQNAVLSGTAGLVGSQLDVLVNLGCPLH